MPTFILKEYLNHNAKIASCPVIGVHVTKEKTIKSEGSNSLSLPANNWSVFKNVSILDLNKTVAIPFNIE